MCIRIASFTIMIICIIFFSLKRKYSCNKSIVLLYLQLNAKTKTKFVHKGLIFYFSLFQLCSMVIFKPSTKPEAVEMKLK